MGLISETAPLGTKAALPNIIDIRSDTGGFELKQDILTGLKKEAGEEKSLPTLLLYDDTGLRLFEEITYLDEYYLTGEEIAILTENAGRIADRIPNGCLVVELGSGYAFTHHPLRHTCSSARQLIGPTAT